MEVLLNEGADPRLYDSDGISPIEVLYIRKLIQYSIVLKLAIEVISCMKISGYPTFMFIKL